MLPMPLETTGTARIDIFASTTLLVINVLRITTSNVSIQARWVSHMSLHLWQGKSASAAAARNVLPRPEPPQGMPAVLAHTPKEPVPAVSLPSFSKHACLPLGCPPVQGSSPGFLGASMAFALCAALSPALYFCARRWYLRHRTAVVLLVRLWATAIFSVAHDIPQPSSASSCTISGWFWLGNSHALTLCFMALGFPLPLR